MQIKKNNGSLEDFNPNKILQRIQVQSEGLKVSPDNILIEVMKNIYDGISSTQLDEMAAREAANYNSVHPDYAVLGGRLLVSRLHKLVGKSNPNLDYSRDFNFNYFSIMSLMKSYLQKKDGVIIETPQDMYWRLANHLGKTEEEKWLFYDYFSRQLVAPASPLLFNGGTDNSSMISCSLIHLAGDSLEGILETYKDAAQHSKDGSGLGIYIGNQRSTKSRVAGRGQASGIPKTCKTLQEIAKQFNQNGSRAGAFAVYVDVWHHDVRQFIELTRPMGNEEMRARDLFTALCVTDNFMEAVRDDKDYYLFCPHEFKTVIGVDLTTLHNEAFNIYYKKGVEAGIGTKVSAREIWNLMIDTAAESGMPYVYYTDTANRKSPHAAYGKIKQSNLCIEIMQYTDEENIASCCLSSVILRSFVRGNKFDFNMLYEAVTVTTRMLNRVLDTNKYSTEKARQTALKQRAIAIGIQGLADVFYMLGISFESEEAKTLNEEILRTMREAAENESERLYKEEGLRGLHFNRANSLLIGLMPTAGTALINNCFESFEPAHSNIFVRELLSGEFVIINRYLIEDLEKLGLWNETLRNQLIEEKGSVQNLDIPANLKEIYKTVFEVPQRTLIDLAAGREPYVDQSQSLNLYIRTPERNKISSMLFHTWNSGLKTGMYYLKSVPRWQDFGAELKKFNKKKRNPDIECFGCSG